MNALRFSEPVYLTVGIGMPVEIDSIERAYATLNEWPKWRRGPAFEVALNACKAAIDGKIDIDTAQSMLAAFASRAGETVESRRLPPACFVPASESRPLGRF
jgi:hypothetical protein